MNQSLLKQLTALLIFLSSLLITLSAQAATFDKLHFIGFSNDGSHMAFETYGTSDGSGHSYAKITIVNVADNEWESSPIKAGTESDMFTVAQARAVVQGQAAAKLTALGITGGITGDHVVNRFLTDLNKVNHPIRFAKALYPSFQKGDFDLILTEKPASRPNCNVFTPPARKIFELRLKNRDTNVTQLLQNDTQLFNSRGCPFRYRVSDVYVHDNRLVVFLSMFGPGFEGVSMSYLAVTGIIQ